MKCDEVRSRLVEYLDGLRGEEGRRLALHLDDCRSCQKEYRELIETIRMVREVELPDPGPDFWHEHRSIIREAARAHLEKGAMEGLIPRDLLRTLYRWLDITFSLVPYRLSGALVLLLVVFSGIMVLRVDRVEINIPRGEVHLVFDEDVLGEAYTSGILFRDFSSLDELNDLSDKELGEVFHEMAVNFGFPPEVEDIFLQGRDDLHVEDEIERLDSGETMRLLELLEEMPVSS